MDYNRKVVEIPLDDVLPNRFQPRIKFNEDSIIELSESIKEHGVIQPIVVRPVGDKFEIIAGERRYKASCMAGLEKIPALITDLNDKDSAEVALIENVQRKDLTPIEEAISYKKILDMGYLTQEKLAEKLGKKQSTVANKLRLLNLDEDVQEAILEDKISERHARSILKLTNPEDQKKILKKIIEERLTVRKTDEEINNMLNGKENEVNTVLPSIPVPSKEEVDKKIEETPFDFSKLDFLQTEFEKEKKQIEIPSFEDILLNIDKDSSNISNPEQIESIAENNIEESNSHFTFEEESTPDMSNDSLMETPSPFSFNDLFLNDLSNNQEAIEEPESIEYIDDLEDDINNNLEEKKLETTHLNDMINSDQKVDAPTSVLGTNTYVANDFKMVINTIRTCAETIEKYGFKLNVEELELPQEYKVTFTVEK